MAAVQGEPLDVYLCSCTDCQRGTGSAFSYAALFPEAAVSIAGERRQYTHRGDSGRAIDSTFCPTCGTAIAFRAEGLPGTLGVPVGCFADPGFPRPSKLFWASRRHHWLELPDTIALIETQ
ncbi:hypothetical protein AUC69_08985 [Methyloceanibacter superfactus]|uniref:CENP-V/GFA domain-containing protein n=2 Tax=Methyloceanibacter superfactus TaxID=1774969 RepID=A0A1E3W1V5_9HYPH|nr:hypothetical protein AUC69_08985 [Methyloceanibacter superfactus]